MHPHAPPLQWFKGYWDAVTGGQEVLDYDAVARRQASKSGDWKKVGELLGTCGALWLPLTSTEL